MPATLKKPRKETAAEETSKPSFVWKTLLFNCDCHTFDQVERQLIKAIRCSLSRARSLSWEVHTLGRAVVYTGPKERCEAVASVLAAIGLIVKISQ